MAHVLLLGSNRAVRLLITPLTGLRCFASRHLCAYSSGKWAGTLVVKPLPQQKPAPAYQLNARRLDISTANKIIGLSESLSRGLPRLKISSAARSDLIALLLLCAVGGSCSFAAAGGD